MDLSHRQERNIFSMAYMAIQIIIILIQFAIKYRYKTENSEKLKNNSNSGKTKIYENSNNMKKEDEKGTEKKVIIIKKEDMKKNVGNYWFNEKNKEWTNVDATNLDISGEVEKQNSVETFES